MIAQFGGDVKDIGFSFREITGIRERALKSRTIRKAFAERGIHPYNPEPMINRLEAQRSLTPELHWPTGDTPPPQSSSIPSSPPGSIIQARRTQGKISRMVDREDLSLYIRKQFDRLTRAQVQLAEEVGLLTSTIQHQLPLMPSAARKSKKQVGKFGALTTKDANRQIAKRKGKDYGASVRRPTREAPLGLEPTPKSVSVEEIVPHVPINIAQAAGYHYHPSFPR
ncbi:hypothetical protein N7448_010950 [Penicillium atrosanguineum]|nr:hypothetical protein N7448_010950 [Penicillium atrosanguineum]